MERYTFDNAEYATYQNMLDDIAERWMTSDGQVCASLLREQAEEGRVSCAREAADCYADWNPDCTIEELESALRRFVDQVVMTAEVDLQ